MTKEKKLRIWDKKERGNNFGKKSGTAEIQRGGGGGNEAPPIVNKEYVCNHDWRFAFEDDSRKPDWEVVMYFHCAKCLKVKNVTHDKRHTKPS